MAEPERPLEGFADLVESLHRPTGPGRGSEWRGGGVAIPPSLDERLRRFARLHQRRAIRPSRMPFARRAPALLLIETTRAQEVTVVEGLARRLERRLFSFDMRDYAVATRDAFAFAMAPLREDRPSLVHLCSLDATPYPADLRDAIAGASPAVAVIATGTASASLDPVLARVFALTLSWAGEARETQRFAAREVPQKT